MKRRLKDAAVLVGVAAFFSGAAAGCNVIVGVGDYSIADGEAPDTSMPVADTGPSSDDAASDAASLLDSGPGLDGSFDAPADVRDARADRVDAAQDAAEGGAPADAAEAAANDSGSDADANEAGADADSGIAVLDAAFDAAPDVADSGAPPTCGAAIPTTTAFTNLVKTCVEVASCDPFVLLVPISECITQDLLHAGGAGTAFSCLSSISDCNGYFACQGVRFATSTECPTFDSRCDGNTAFNCDFSFPIVGQVTNCALIPGGTCLHHVEGIDDVADCVVQPSCVGSGTDVCAGNSNSVCTTVTGSATNVGLGRACVDATCTTAPGVGCTFDGTALCTAETSSSCSGTAVAQQCGSPVQTFDYDCTKAGGTCVPNGANAAVCVSPGCTAAVATSCVESCDGANTITACVGGAPYTIDCTQYGFGSCGTTGNGHAYCSP